MSPAAAICADTISATTNNEADLRASFSHPCSNAYTAPYLLEIPLRTRVCPTAGGRMSRYASRTNVLFTGVLGLDRVWYKSSPPLSGVPFVVEAFIPCQERTETLVALAKRRSSSCQEEDAWGVVMAFYAPIGSRAFGRVR